MRRRSGQSGMTLLEVVITLATILVLISALLGVGGYIKTRANIDLTESMLEVLSTALEQYYQDQAPNAFPFVTEKDITGDGVVDPYDRFHLEYDLGGVVAGGLLDEDASSAALFYFLDQYPSSRAIASAVSNSLITNKDDTGLDIQIELPPGSGIFIDLPRYIDPWGTSIRYVYLPGTAFPTLTSAGSDRMFGTPDDITSK